MAVMGKTNARVVYYDFDRILTYSELLSNTRHRFDELIGQGFSREQTIKIIFDSNQFKASFLFEKSYESLKMEFHIS